MKQLLMCMVCILCTSATTYAQNHLHVVNSSGGELVKLESKTGFPHMVLSNDHGNIFRIGLAETENMLAPNDDDLYIKGMKPFSRIRMEVGDGTGKGGMVINPTSNINNAFLGAFVGINANSPAAPLTVSSIEGGITAEFRTQQATTYVEWTAGEGGPLRPKGYAGFIDEMSNPNAKHNFRIGTTALNPNGALDFRTNDANRMTIKNTGEVFIGDFASFPDLIQSNPQALNICGNTQASGNFTANAFFCSSDGRFKTEINPLNNSLQNIMELNGVSYKWNTEDFAHRGFTEDNQIGLIAQDVEGVLPELVKSTEDGYKSVDYQSLTAVLVEAIKEQQQTIETLEHRLSVLENKD